MKSFSLQYEIVTIDLVKRKDKDKRKKEENLNVHVPVVPNQPKKSIC